MLSYEISVLMAINKYDEYTSIAINSIIAQKAVDLQFVIVVNGSDRDNIYDILYSQYGKFEYIYIIKTVVGQLASALNYGIDFCRSDYIARMDSDDISHPLRLRKQLDYIILHNLDVVGANIKKIDSIGETIGEVIYPQNRKINKMLIFKNPFCHPSVVFKKSIVLSMRGYNAGFASEDYELWIRMDSRGQNIKWDNIQEFLLEYRVHETGTQKNPLAYIEVFSFFIREFFLCFKAKYFLGAMLSLFKYIKEKVYSMRLK